MPEITLKGISKVYRTKEIETTALDNINLDINAGEFVSIMGPSGCGKSTLLNIMGLLDTPSAGTVEIAGTTSAGMSDSALAHFRNVELSLTYRTGIGAKERRERVEEVLHRLGISHRIKHFPSQLSGGQCQRVAIARAIVGKPSIILADEPTGNLDSAMGEEVMELLHSLNRNDGLTVVMVTHNEAHAHGTDRTVRFFDGRIIS